MNYMYYMPWDDTNGEGVRCTLFVAGCEMGCKGCHNPESWRLNAGKKYTKEFEDQIINDLKNEYLDGISISGGNPTHPKNVATITSLCKRVKEETGKSVWVWSGSTIEVLRKRQDCVELLQLVNVLIDGKFEQDLYNPSLKWRGSSNQRVIKLN